MADAKKYTSKLDGARILIFGGSSGIGYGAAEASIESGATVIISSSSESKIQASVKSLNESYPSAKDRISGYACNLGDPEAVESNIVALFEKVGTVNHIVYTAGDSLALVPIQTATLSDMNKAGLVRFFAPLLVAKHLPKYLSPGPASSFTLTTGSVSERPIPNWSVVNGFATGIEGLTRGLALDLAPIRVNAIRPGAVETPLWAGVSAEAREALAKRYNDDSCTGTLGKVEDVAEAYLYVMKDHNVTGTVISTNSGVMLK
jgi:NAD(P)-dependent dehydrogenase (short-subunit alcohol dehydrogenase family)